MPTSRSDAEATRNWLSRQRTVTCCRREHFAEARGCVISSPSDSKPESHMLNSSCNASPRTLGLAVEDERTVKEDSMREET